MRQYLFLDGLTLWNSPLWFFPTLFTVYVIFYCILRLSKTHDLPVVAITALFSFAITAVLYINGKILLFFGIDKALHMLGYTCIGHILRKIYDMPVRYRLKPQKISLYSFFAFFIFIVLSIAVNKEDNISVLACDFNNILLYIPLAVLGSASFMFMFYGLKELNTIKIISKDTAFIMSSHCFLLSAWSSHFEITYPLGALIGLITFIALSYLCFLINYLINRYNLTFLKKIAGCFGIL